jgi:transposase
VWRNRYLKGGLAGLQDQPRSGRPRQFSPLGTARCDLSSQQHDRPTGLSRHPVGVG